MALTVASDEQVDIQNQIRTDFLGGSFDAEANGTSVNHADLRMVCRKVEKTGGGAETITFGGPLVAVYHYANSGIAQSSAYLASEADAQAGTVTMVSIGAGDFWLLLFYRG